ncbi:MAG TPA: hypothetical protein VGF55_24895 [Gemmataceae bacterium]
MNRRKKQIGVVLGLVAIAFFAAAVPLYKWYRNRPVSARLFEKTKALVEKNPQLQPAWDAAVQDGVLTWPEAREIWDRAGEKPEPEQ